MKTRTKACIAILTLFCGACTTRGAFEAVRQNARNTCQTTIPESDRAACLARIQDDYDSYSKKRQAVVHQ